MPVLRTSYPVALAGLLLAVFLAVPAIGATARAADNPPHRACLSKAEQRAAVAAGKAVPLASAIRSLHAKGRRAEVVRAELCERDGGLVYVLTLLSGNGKVTRAAVDAANGAIINGF